MVDKYEDPFVRIASMIGGDEYLKVARSLLKAEDATDEEIASSTGLRINMVRKVLYDLFGKSLITGIRVKDGRKGWFVYRWRTRREEVEHFIENQKKVIDGISQEQSWGSTTSNCDVGNISNETTDNSKPMKGYIQIMKEGCQGDKKDIATITFCECYGNWFYDNLTNDKFTEFLQLSREDKIKFVQKNNIINQCQI